MKKLLQTALLTMLSLLCLVGCNSDVVDFSTSETMTEKEDEGIEVPVSETQFINDFLDVYIPKIEESVDIISISQFDLYETQAGRKEDLIIFTDSSEIMLQFPITDESDILKRFALFGENESLENCSQDFKTFVTEACLILDKDVDFAALKNELNDPGMKLGTDTFIVASVGTVAYNVLESFENDIVGLSFSIGVGASMSQANSHTLQDITYSAPYDWRVEEVGNGFHHYPNKGNEYYIATYTAIGGIPSGIDLTDKSDFSYAVDLFVSQEEGVVESNYLEIEGNHGWYFHQDPIIKTSDGSKWESASYLIASGGEILSFSFVTPEGRGWVLADVLKHIFDTVEFIDPDLLEDVEPTPEPATTSVTMGEKNALAKAKEYLNVMAFSHTGLIRQLEYEAYSYDEAVYGADNCGADWNKQAEIKAKEYLEAMSFSRQGLIDQLIYEGYTQDQAVYGVTENGY